MANKSKKKQPRSQRSKSPHRPPHRNRCLDTLRGLAILLMIVDHIAGVLWGVDIEPTTIRFLTRLSMPLFAVLMGFLLAASTTTNWRRYLQLALAAAVMNVVFYSVYRELEILASLWVCYSLFLVLRLRLAWLFVAAYFYAWDPSRQLFDYPLSLVVTCVAQGVILRCYGWRVATATGALGLLAIPLLEAPTLYALYFLLPAIGLVAWGASQPQRFVPGVETLGRYPLTAYLTQYFIILSLDAVG